MSSPADVDLGDLHLQKQSALADQELDEWVRQMSASLQPPASAGPQPSATPELQDPSAPAPPGTPAGPDPAVSVAKDVGRGLIAAPREALGGALDAIENLAALPKDLGDWLSSTLPNAVRRLPQGVIYEPGKGFRVASGADLEAVPGLLEKLGDKITPDIEGSGTVTGGLIRGAAQFVTGFLGAGSVRGIQMLKQAGAAGALAAPVAQSALASFGAFDPQEARLSNLVQEFPVLANPVTEYLAADPADSDAEGRFKLALEGAGLAALGEGMLRGVRALRFMRAAKAAARVGDEAIAEVVRTTERQSAKLRTLAGDTGAPAVEIAPPAATEGARVAPDAPGRVFINMARIESPEDVKAVVQGLADARGGNISEAARGTRSWEAIRLSAEQQDAWEILRSRQKGQALNAEQSLAVRELWVQSGAKLTQLAREVAENPSELSEIALNRQLALHNAIQEQVIPARTETARALNAWRIPVTGNVVGNAGTLEGLAALQGATSGRTRELAAGIVKLADAGLAPQVDAFVEASFGAKSAQAIRQTWYAMLLTNPKTFARNLIGNTSQLLLEVPEAKVANYLGRIRGAENVPTGEAMERLYGLIDGYKSAFRVSQKSRDVFQAAMDRYVAGDEDAARALFAEDAAQFFAPGGPAEAQGGARPLANRTEGAFDPAVWGWGADTIPGRFFSFMDTATTAGSRVLQKSDEVFKGMAYAAELRAQAFRQATGEVATGKVAREGFADRLAELLTSPTDQMRMSARMHAEVQTFSNNPAPTKLWGWIKAWHDVPVFGDITMPFARTPYNIATQTLQRTPLAPFGRAWRQDILAGGARGDLAWSRFITGNAILLTAADFAVNGHLTGEGPKDPQERATLLRTGWRPWSAKIGDQYVDYRSIDPIGPLIGLAANTVDVLRAQDFADAAAKNKTEKLVSAVTIALAAQVTNQSFMTGASDFFDVISDPTRNGENYVKRLATSAIVPRGVANLERALDPDQRYAWDIADQIRSETPGLSKELPFARDRWGRKLTGGTGYGPWVDLISPVGVSKIAAEPIDSELQRLEHWIGNPAKQVSIHGASIDLSGRPKLYSRYLELQGNAWAPEDGQGLKDTLNALVSGKHEDSETYQELTDGPDGTKAMMIDKLVQIYQQGAREQLLAEFPELQAEVDARLAAKQSARTPTR